MPNDPANTSDGSARKEFDEEADRLEAIRATLDSVDWNDPAAATAAAEESVAAYRWLLKRFQRTLRLADRMDLQLKNTLDRSEKQKLELQETVEKLESAREELVRSEKLAALGAMVAGIAHEINTPVGIIRTAASALQTQTKSLHALASNGQARKSDVFGYFERALEATDLIEANSERASDLIRSFKEVAVDRSSGARRRFELVGYIREVIKTLRPTLKEANASVQVTAQESIDIDGFPGQLSQVFTNLVQNSIVHGFEGRSSGNIEFECRTKSPGWVEIIYSDDGVGVPSEIQAKIFDPFVTTKRGAGGSGLGLNILHSIVVDRMGGRVRYRDRDGGGACFEIELPVEAPQSDEAES